MLGLNLNYVVKKYISLSKWYLPRLNWQTKQGNMRKPKLSHWGRVMHICVSELTIIGSDNGLTPGRRQAIIWPNVWIALIGPSGTNYSEILIAINIFSFKKIHLKMSSAKCRPFCLGLNMLSCRQLAHFARLPKSGISTHLLLLCSTKFIVHVLVVVFLVSTTKIWKWCLLPVVFINFRCLF